MKFESGKLYKLKTDLKFQTWEINKEFILDPDTCILFLYNETNHKTAMGSVINVVINYFLYDNKKLWRISTEWDYDWYEELSCLK